MFLVDRATATIPIKLITSTGDNVVKETNANNCVYRYLRGHLGAVDQHLIVKAMIVGLISLREMI